MSLKNVLINLDEGDSIDAEFNAVIVSVTEKPGKHGAYWIGTMADPHDPSYKINFISGARVEKNWKGDIVTCKGSGWSKKPDYNGTKQIGVGGKGIIEHFGSWVEESKPSQAKQTGALATSDGKKPPRQQMLDMVQGITDGMSINNATLIVCAYKELFLDDIKERGLGPVLHEISTTIIDVAIQHEQGNYAPLESERRAAAQEPEQEPEPAKPQYTESDF